MLQGPKKYLRISYQAFNEVAELDYLMASLKEISADKALLNI